MDHSRRFAIGARLLAGIGGDGASATVPRRKLGIFRVVSHLVHYPGTRLFIEIKVMLMNRRRWVEFWRDQEPGLRAVCAGPVVAAVGTRLVGVDDPAWRDQVADYLNQLPRGS